MHLFDEMETGLSKCEEYTLMTADEKWWGIWRLNKPALKEKGYAVCKVLGKFYVFKPNSDV